jgi:hypothetical protein
MPYAPQWAALTPALHRLHGIEFDLRGIVELADPELKARFPEMVQHVVGIAIRQRCRRLHFLQATVDEQAAGSVVARYRVHYAGGPDVEIPVIYGRDVLYWTANPPSSAGPLREAWKERLPADAAENAEYGRLFLSTWENPRPDMDIVSLDFVSEGAGAAAFVSPITAEP